MVTTNFGRILKTVHYKQKTFVITEYKSRYYLIEHHRGFDTTDVLLITDDMDLVNFKLKEELKK